MASHRDSAARAGSTDDSLGPVMATLDRPRVADPVTIAVVADAHLATDHRGTWKTLHRTEARLRTALDAAAEGSDAVVFAGDQTHDGHHPEFERFHSLAGELAQPWVGLPGNHDVPKAYDEHDGPSFEAVCRHFTGDAAPPDTGEACYPLTLQVGELRIVCVNTAAPTDVDLRSTWAGAVGPAQRERLREMVAATPETPTLLVAHHNLGALPEHEAAYPWDRFPADDATAVRSLLADADVPLAVTGHQHVPAVQHHGTVTELMAPATCSFPQAMLRLRVGPDGTCVRFVPLAGPSGIREAYWHAVTGTALGRGILDMALDRVTDL